MKKESLIFIGIGILGYYLSKILFTLYQGSFDRNMFFAGMIVGLICFIISGLKIKFKKTWYKRF